MHILSEIQSRFATTDVVSEIENTSGNETEVGYSIFISRPIHFIPGCLLCGTSGERIHQVLLSVSNQFYGP